MGSRNWNWGWTEPQHWHCDCSWHKLNGSVPLANGLSASSSPTGCRVQGPGCRAPKQWHNADQVLSSRLWVLFTIHLQTATAWGVVAIAVATATVVYCYCCSCTCYASCCGSVNASLPELLPLNPKRLLQLLNWTARRTAGKAVLRFRLTVAKTHSFIHNGCTQRRLATWWAKLDLLLSI